MHRKVGLGRLIPQLYFIVFKMGNPMERVACLCLHVQPRERDSAFTLHSGCAAQPAPPLFPLPSPPRAFQLSASALISSPPGLAAYCSHLSAGLTASLGHLVPLRSSFSNLASLLESWCCGPSPPLRQGSCGTTCSSLSARQTPFEAANTEASVLCTDCNGNRKDEEPKIRMVVFTSRNRQWHRWRHGLHAVDQVQPNV